MGYALETNSSPFAPTKLHYRTEEISPRSLEPFEPPTHSSSHSNDHINLELISLDPNSPRATEFWKFPSSSATLNPIVQLTRNIFDIPFPTQLSCLESPCSSSEIMYV
ncbi:hypothetical protein TNCV_4913081 [Trichonephila clavipes]|nr:hypothetical protein TNCV_4913081 [Trichonephila clavipes]